MTAIYGNVCLVRLVKWEHVFNINTHNCEINVSITTYATYQRKYSFLNSTFLLCSNLMVSLEIKYIQYFVIMT